MADSAQAQVRAFIEQDAGQPEQQLSLLLESLEAYARDYGGAFVELHASASELHDLYQQQAPADQIAEKRDHLEKVAELLTP